MRSTHPKVVKDECRGDSRDERKDESKDASVSSGKKQAKVRPFGGRASVPATQHIGSFLSIKDLSRLSVVSRDNHKALDAMVNSEKLLERVVKGQEKLVRMMLDANPRLLLDNRAVVKDYSGKRIHGLTAFQAALCAGDVDMLKMMRPYFGKLDKGGHHLAEQINAVFPDGYEQHIKRQRKEDCFDFTPVCTAIWRASTDEIHDCYHVYQGLRFKEFDASRDKPDEELILVEALNRFREKFTKKSMGETIYNPDSLVRALQIFHRIISSSDWSHYQKNLFHNQVLGFCERFVPACTAQKIAQGLPAKPFSRSLKFQNENCHYFPIETEHWINELPCDKLQPPEHRTSDCRMDGLGFDIAALPNGHVNFRTSGYNANLIGWLAKRLRKHFKKKTKTLQAFITDNAPSTPDDAVTATKK